MTSPPQHRQSAPPRTSPSRRRTPRSAHFSLSLSLLEHVREPDRACWLTRTPPLARRAKPTTDETDAPAAETKDDDEEGEDVSGELAHLDQSNIIEGGRRTRGKKVDYAALDAGDEADEEEDEDDAEVNESELKEPAEGEGEDEGDEEEGDDE